MYSQLSFLVSAGRHQLKSGRGLYPHKPLLVRKGEFHPGTRI